MSAFGLPSLQAMDASTPLRIWLCTGRTDMRCGFDRLAAMLTPLHTLMGRRGLRAFRHQGATVMANDSHMPIVQVQRMLGHRSLKTTEQYLHPHVLGSGGPGLWRVSRPNLQP